MAAAAKRMPRDVVVAKGATMATATHDQIVTVAVKSTSVIGAVVTVVRA